MTRYNAFKEHHNDHYVYEMMDNLCPSQRKSGKWTNLFSIEELQKSQKTEKDSDFKYKILNQLDTNLGLNLNLRAKHEPVIELKVLRSSYGFVVILQYKPNPPIIIPLEFKNRKLGDTSSICILSESENGGWTIAREYDVKIKQEFGKHVVYYEMPNRSAVATIDYLDVIHLQSTPNDRTSLEGIEVFVLNVQGFLLFLSNLVNLRKRKSKSGEEKNKIPYSKWIHDVLLNPRLIDILPFLSNWKEFEEEGFPVTNVLMDIATELQSQLEVKFSGLNSNSTAYLTQRSTELYFARLNHFFFYKIDENSPFWYLYLKEHDFDFDKLKTIRRRVNEYRVFILGLLKNWHEENLHDIKELISMYEIVPGKT